MIIDLTHNADGTEIIRRSVTTKVAIGKPPSEGQNYPQRVDHFLFQRKTSKKVMKEVKQQDGSKKNVMVDQVVWDEDADMMAFYGKDCREFWIVLMDDDPTTVFKTEMAIWTRTQKVCSGDGELAWRISKDNPNGADHTPCANHGCKELEAKLCKPCGDLYFVLADFPALGTIAKLHTSGWQSIREISSALADLRNVTGGRLMGVRCKLTMRLENSSYMQGNVRKAGTKWVLGIELTAKDIQQLADGLASGLAFDSVRKRLGAKTSGPAVVIDDEIDEGDAEAIAAEFYPPAGERPAEKLVEIKSAAPEGKVNPKTYQVEYDQQPIGRGSPNEQDAAAARAQPETGNSEAPLAAIPAANAQGVTITDDDLPAEFFQVQEQPKADPTPIGKGERATRFYNAWMRRKRPEAAVRAYLHDVHKVETSWQIRSDRYDEALHWAKNPLREDQEPLSDDEKFCRDGFAALGMNMIDQMELIDDAKANRDDGSTDWAAVRSALNAAADAEAGR